jgi:mRNA interferase MazF
MPITGTVVRGSIVRLNLHPAKGHEQHGWRPAIVISDGIINDPFACIVPVTNQAKGNPFELTVPQGIAISSSHPDFRYTHLAGVALRDQFKTLDLDERNAEVIGQVDTRSKFYKELVMPIIGTLIPPSPGK